MRKTLRLFICVLFAKVSLGQAYVKTVVIPASGPNECDGSIIMTPYGATPPFSIEWYDNKTWHQSSGLRADHLCPQSEGFHRITIIDANCLNFTSYVTMGYDTGSVVELDTIIMQLPTFGNNDGSIEIHFTNVPTGLTTVFSGGTVGSVSGDDTLFTGLGEGYYQYSVYTPSHVVFLVTIPLFIGASYSYGVCDPFISHANSTDALSTYSNTLCQGNATLPDPGTCSGSIHVISIGASSVDLIYDTQKQVDGGLSDADPNNFDNVALNLCDGAYTTYFYDSSFYVAPNNFYNVQGLFVHDTLDPVYFWNIPDSIPQNTDTLSLDALNVPAIHYSAGTDTLFISSINYFGQGQYEIHLDLIQGGDTFYLHVNEYLDSAFNYVFDFTTFEGDSLLCDVANNFHHWIYFEWPETEEPCDSVYICHVPEGNPSAAHTILIPCEDIEDHIGNHSLDYMGPCYENGNVQNVQPSNGAHNDEGRKETTPAAVKTLKVFPNPFEQRLQVSASDVIQSVAIYSFDGKQILIQTVQSNQAMLDVKSLVPSTYFIKVNYTDGAMEMRKLVKLK